MARWNVATYRFNKTCSIVSQVSVHNFSCINCCIHTCLKETHYLWSITRNEKFINRQPVPINSVWSLLHEDFCKNWEDNIKMMPKLRTYIKLKNDFEVEPYVFSIMSRQRRSYLAQLRNGILLLQLEVGRWANKAVEERLCLICNNGTVEDEEHFLFSVISITVNA